MVFFCPNSNSWAWPKPVLNSKVGLLVGFSPFFASVYIWFMCIYSVYTTVYGKYFGSFPCISNRIKNLYNQFWPLQPVLPFLITYLLCLIVYQCIKIVFQPAFSLQNLLCSSSFNSFKLPKFKMKGRLEIQFNDMRGSGSP